MAGMQSTGMMERMTSHMQMMETMSGDSMVAMMAAHRQMGEDMLDRMTNEMRDMNMQPNARCNATADSVRQDMARMGGYECHRAPCVDA